MKMELFIDGEKKIFTTPFVPMLARRKYIEFEASDDIDMNKLTIDQFDEIYSILPDIVFNRQFTLQQMYAGAEEKYISDKLVEAVFGIKPNDKKKDDENDEGNEMGK